MPKQKTRKSVKKRFRLNAKGAVKRKQAFRSHLLTKKKSKRKRELRKNKMVDKTQADKIRSMLHN
jgi:large subunit ribosomal protein L35